MRLFKSEKILENSAESPISNESSTALQDLLKIWRSDSSDLQSNILKFIATMETFSEDLNPLIFFCAQRGYADAILQLHLYGANVLAQDFRGNTALHEACHKVQIAVVETLLSLHDKPLQNLEGHTPAHYAVMSSSIDVLTLLLPYHYFDRVDNNGDSPLHWAASDGKTEVISFLVENGAGINKNAQNKWPWELAYSNNPDDISSINLFLSICLKNDTGYSQEFFSWLFKNEATKNLHGLLRSSDIYPVHMLANLGKINILKSLDSRFLKETNKVGELPLHMAIKAKEANHKVCALLLFKETFLARADDLSILKKNLLQVIQILNFSIQHDRGTAKELFRLYFYSLIDLCTNAYIKRKIFFEMPLVSENEKSYSEAIFEEKLPTALKLIFAVIKRSPDFSEECFILLETLYEKLRNEKKRAGIIQKVLSSLYELNPERAANIELDLLHRQGAVLLLLARASVLLSEPSIAVKDVVKVKLAELLLANFYTGDSFAKTWLSGKIHERLKCFPKIDPRIKMDDILSHPYFQYLRAIQALEYLNNCSHKFASNLRARCNKVLGNVSGSQLMEESELENSWTEAAMTISILDGMNRIKHPQQEAHFLKTLPLLGTLHDFIDNISKSKNNSIKKENNLNPEPSAPPLDEVEQGSQIHKGETTPARDFANNSSGLFVLRDTCLDDVSASEFEIKGGDLNAFF